MGDSTFKNSQKIAIPAKGWGCVSSVACEEGNRKGVRKWGRIGCGRWLSGHVLTTEGAGALRRHGLAREHTGGMNAREKNIYIYLNKIR